MINARCFFPSVLLTLACGAMILASCGGEEEPSGPPKESLTAREKLPQEYKDKVNPYAGDKATAEVIAQGKASYEANCLTCHGATGLGDGNGGTMLNPKPGDLTSADVQSKVSDQYIFWRITVGGTPFGTGMTAFEMSIPEDDRWKIVAYVRTLKK